MVTLPRGGGLVFKVGGYKYQNQKKTGGIFFKTMKNGGVHFLLTYNNYMLLFKVNTVPKLDNF